MNTHRTILIGAIMLLTLTTVSADLALDSVTFDPAIISSGDEVDIVIQYRDTATTFDGRAGDPDYTFRVELESDDALTREYVRITDPSGNPDGTLFAGKVYRRVFRAKVAQDAPAGTYEFLLSGQWLRNGEPVEGRQIVRFSMDVKREALLLEYGSLTTDPVTVRQGDDDVLVTLSVSNAGEKPLKTLTAILTGPTGIDPGASDANRRSIGVLGPGETRDLTFTLDISEELTSGLYELSIASSFRDLDDREYARSETIPILIEGRPRLEITNSSGSALIGRVGELRVTVTNTGDQSAESVDVRVLPQSGQPFRLDVRSDYLGTIEPGESRDAVFELETTRDADDREYDLEFVLRTRGDSDRGDDRVYTYSETATYEVSGEAFDRRILIGLGVLLIAIGVILWRRR